jgi:hypothetical protein
MECELQLDDSQEKEWVWPDALIVFYRAMFFAQYKHNFAHDNEIQKKRVGGFMYGINVLS